MIAARFVFRQARTDEEFERLNEAVLQAAERLDGYRGRESWENGDGDLAAVYWWDSLEELRKFARDPVHRRAKARWREWYEGYRVEVFRLLQSYGEDLPPGPASSRGTGPDSPGRNPSA